jgi:hypothetical protein
MFHFSIDDIIAVNHNMLPDKLDSLLREGLLPNSTIISIKTIKIVPNYCLSMEELVWWRCQIKQLTAFFLQSIIDSPSLSRGEFAPRFSCRIFTFWCVSR